MSRENFDQQIRREVLELENQIYDIETFYLQNTRESGNLLRGFDNYQSGKAPRNQVGKRPKIQNIQRLFSLTSVKSKTSEGLEENMISEFRAETSKKRRMESNKDKMYNGDNESLDNSASPDNIYSESSSNIKNRKNKKKIGKSGKGLRRN